MREEILVMQARRKQEQFIDSIRLLCEYKAKICARSIPTILLDVKTGEMTFEHSQREQAILNQIDQQIEMIREHIFPSSTTTRGS